MEINKNKADDITKRLFKKILNEGCLDMNPRPHYEDKYPKPTTILDNAKGTKDFYFENHDKLELESNQTFEIKNGELIISTPAHTISINHEICTYDLSKGELPIITLRPIASKSAIGALLWIYQDQSNNLDLLRDKYNVKWWDEWDIGNRTIGSCYGETVRKHDLMNKLLHGLKTDPDGRRHIMNLWQEEDFTRPHGLKPCAYQTVWNVRHGQDGNDYLDMCLFQIGRASCRERV